MQLVAVPSCYNGSIERADTKYLLLQKAMQLVKLKLLAGPGGSPAPIQISGAINTIFVADFYRIVSQVMSF